MTFFSAPLNEPIGVRAAETIKTSLICDYMFHPNEISKWLSLAASQAWGEDIP